MSNLHQIIKTFENQEGLSQDEVKHFLKYLSGDHKYSQKVVGIREFIESKAYLDCKGSLYPEILNCLEEFNNGQYSEGVLTGAIGTGKTTIALYTNAYQLYLLSCLRDPHQEFGLDPSSEIVFIFQNLNAKKAKEVDYERFRALMDSSPYFTKYFSYNKDMKSQMEFPNRIYVKPVCGDQSAAIGENVIGGLIDEVNFMDVIEQSKQSVDGGKYDQAKSLYHSLARRRESRFMKDGKLPGILCLVSSKRYPGEFTDRKAEEAKTDSSIYVYDRRIWDVKPKGTFSNKMFRVFVGDQNHNPYILDESAETGDDLTGKVLEVPVDYRKQFERDIHDALREIGGVSLRTTNPFIQNLEAVKRCFGTHKSILNRTETDFTSKKLLIYPHRVFQPDLERFIHIDLALTNDSAGFVMGCIPKFVEFDRGYNEHETLPKIHIDCALEIKPPVNGEIDFSRIRSLIYKCKDIGINVTYVTLDSYQSIDMIQILQRQGFKAGIRSMDKKPLPYDMLKTALYDGRVACPDHPKLFDELISLERNGQTGKIDHIPSKSKDLSDALAGVVYGLSMQRATWVHHNAPLWAINSFKSKITNNQSEFEHKPEMSSKITLIESGNTWEDDFIQSINNNYE
jgi:hypothetical protein